MSPRELHRPLISFIAGIAMMFSIGALYAWSVFIVPLERELAASRSELSAVFSLATVSFTLCMLFGARLYHHVSAPTLGFLTGALAAGGLLLAGTGTSSIIAIGIGFGVLFGLANGLGYGLSLQVVQAAYPERRGLVTGLSVASYTAGSAVFAGLFAWGIQLYGPGGTFRMTAVYMLAVGIAVFILLKLSGIRISPTTRHAPLFVARDFSIKFWVLWLGLFFSAFAGVMVLGHAATIVGALGADPETMALGVALIAIGNGIGRLAGGWLCDWQPPRRFLAPLLFLAALCLLILLIWSSVLLAMVALTFMGIGYGSVAGSYPVIVSKIYGLVNVSQAYGRVFTAWGVAALSGPYVGGLLFDWAGDYGPAIAIGAGAALVASFVCLAIQVDLQPTAQR